MPGVKRSLPAGQEPSTTSEGEIGSRPNGAQRKRIRLSDEHDREDASDEETDEEIQNLQATQFHDKQKQRRFERNGPAENGIIESVTLTNFMCHGFLHVEIGPLINFIIGHNGSGKSAVLTALTVCLGGKASATNRASSLKAFIKEGTETCTLSVKIKNGGDDGYRPELYGASIVVERSFSRSGTSSFRLKNADGRIMSTKRSDLEDISDYYALQLDNPINVLTQDNARQFLSGSNAAEKYKFFIKGVQLEQLNRDYDLLHESIAQIETTFEDKRVFVRQLKQEKDKSKATFDLLSHNESLISKINLVRSQVAWSQVEEQEALLQQAHDDLRSLAEDLQNTEGALNEKDLLLSERETTRTECSNEQAQVQEQLDAVLEEVTAARSKQSDLKEEAVNAQRDERTIDDEIKANQTGIATTKSDIESEMARLDEVNGGSVTRYMEELEAQKSAVDEARQRHRDHVAARSDIKEEEKALLEEQKLVEDRRRLKLEEKAACDTRLRDLRNQGQRRSFKPNMSRLIDAIASCNEFRERPIGPIGDHIQLTDPQWLSILERSLGDVLESFIVTNKPDQRCLAELMRRFQCQSSIVIGSRVPIDTSSHEPDSQFDTILRVLRIDNEMIKRQLVINQGIEQTILIPTLKEAREVMDRTRLANVKQCFSHQPHSRNAGERLNYGMGGSLNSSFVPAWQKLPRMRTQIEDSIAFEQNCLQRLEREIGEINTDLNQFRAKFTALKQKFTAHDRQERNLKADIQSAQQLSDDIQEKIDANNIEEGRLDALRQALSSFEEDAAHLQNVHEDAVRDKEKHTTKWKAMEPEIRGIEGRRRTLESLLRSTKEKVRKAEEARQAALFEKNKLHDSINSLQRRQSHAEQDKSSLEETVADFSRQASSVGERVPIDEGQTTDSLEKKMEKLERDLRNYEQSIGGSAEKITRDYQRASARYAEIFSQFETEQKLAQLLRQTLNAREERWRLFRQKISARARATFVFVLSERSFHGHLKINHRYRKLEIQVQPDDTQRERNGREASSLSGGEKSYSTICLLLSLWDAVGAPIRCLDEFDVYMDSVNREISMKLLIRAARNAVGRQFILISPQSGVVDSAPDVKIIKMQDPERNNNQTRLSFVERP